MAYVNDIRYHPPTAPVLATVSHCTLETLVSTRGGQYFHIRVGLHRSACSPLVFILIMDVTLLQAEFGKEPPWVMLFADDLVICERSRAEVELQLERWRETFESHGLRVSRRKQSTCHAQK